MRTTVNRETAFQLFKQYNQEGFHIQHALTVEGVMKWFAQKLGYELNTLLDETLQAMRWCEQSVMEEMKRTAQEAADV